jgi:hypothetical protein
MASKTKRGPSLLTGAAGIAAPVTPGSAPQDTRLWFLDHLRLVLICGVVVVHVANIYGAGGWYQYHEPAQADALIRYTLAIPSLIANLFGMGFFFLIAGYFTPGSYDRKGGASFVRNRLVRLGIPLLLYDLLLDPFGGLHRTGAARLPLELLWPLSAAGAHDCPGGRLVHHHALALHPALCRLALADQEAIALCSRARKTTQHARDPGVHRRAGPGKLCGANLVAAPLGLVASLVGAAVQPASKFASPVS